ncbi:MAG: 3-keto-5-aminohexanoate cleavage protein [Chloroflexi bacterium]|nr:3-keto-5-aminohexanoate cleavage protein [Chloroflexota bacterium]
MDKLIITVAPTGSVPTKAQNPYLPVTPQEIADTAYRCWQIGASIVHVHARDDQGHPTLDPAVFARIYELISGRCDIIVQISTGGRAGMDPEARAAAVRRLHPEMASLTTGSMNFPDRVYENPFSTIEYLARAMKEAGTRPEMEIFEAGMIANAQLLVEQGLATEPLHFNFVLGSHGSLPATPKNLLYLSELIPSDATWTASGLGRWQLPVTALALVMGGHVRVGLEDNLYYRRGELASNEQLVERMVRLADELGRPVATPDEARAILHLTPPQHTSDD